VTYQLVIQAHSDALEDYDVMLAIEARLASAIDSLGEVDGHDVGSGETNIFISAEDPRAVFARVYPILEKFRILDRARAAYRRVGDGTYTLLWPPNSEEEFSIL
jgi:hypothetical protein